MPYGLQFLFFIRGICSAMDVRRKKRERKRRRGHRSG